MKVAKFGGTSLANASQIKKVCNIVLSDPERRIVVVSAPGKRFKEDIKITDMLIDLAETALENGDYEPKIAGITARYDEIARELGVPGIAQTISADLHQRVTGDRSNVDKYMDRLKAAGEDNNAKLVAAYLVNEGYDAHYIDPKEAGMLLSDDFGNAVVLPETYEKLAKLRDMTGILIFPGFFGYSKSGDVVTFPRGGSDITGAIIAAAVRADLYENFTDVDFVYAVNPKVVSNPVPILKITYREMRELSYAGFNVYQEEALRPVYKLGIPVNIKNVNNPTCPGTLIVQTREHSNPTVVGIASDDGFSCIDISKYLMNREIGFGRRVLGILEDEKISYEHTPTGIDDMSVIMRSNQLSEEKIDKIIYRLKNELNVDEVSVEHGLSLVMVVGESMSNAVGIAAKVTTALAQAGVNIEMISQGSSEVSMLFAVYTGEVDKAVRAIYNAVFEK